MTDPVSPGNNPPNPTSPKPLLKAKTPPPVSAEERQLMAELRQRGYGLRRIAQVCKRNRKTVRSILQEQSPASSPTQQSAASKLDPFRESIRDKVEKRLTTSRILREIRELGYTGGRTILAAYARSLRAPLAPGRPAKRRFETRPGEESQVDWADYTVPIAGKPTRVHALVVMLAHSRKAHVHFYRDEQESTLLEGLTLAFEEFDGVTSRVVFDNMATVVLGRIGPDRKPVWHPRFRDFARFYAFAAFLCKVRDPDRKGKDERFIDYLEKDFVRGSEFASFAELNHRVRIWTSTIANQRRHGTTGLVPDEVWQSERDFLIRLPEARFATHQDSIRDVGPAATLSVGSTLYTVPETLKNKTVPVRLYAEHFEVLNHHGQVAFSRRYVEDADKGKLQLDPTHYAPSSRSSPSGAGSRLDEVLLNRFPGLAGLVEGIQLKMKALAPIHLRSLLRLAALYGDEAFLSAAGRAQDFHRYNAAAVQRILEREHPLAETAPAITPVGESARALSAIGEVETGSFDAYDDIDTAAPCAEDNDDQP
jgi:transposase